MTATDMKRAAVARALMLHFRGFEYGGTDAELLESYNPRSVEAVKAADEVLRLARKRYHTKPIKTEGQVA